MTKDQARQLCRDLGYDPKDVLEIELLPETIRVVVAYRDVRGFRVVDEEKKEFRREYHDHPYGVPS